MNDREMVAVLASSLTVILQELRHVCDAQGVEVLNRQVQGTSRSVGNLLSTRIEQATRHLGGRPFPDTVVKGFPHPHTPGPFDGVARGSVDYTDPINRTRLGEAVAAAMTPTGEGIARQLCAAGYVLADAAYRLGVADAGCRVSWMDTVRYEAAADVFRERAGKATDPDLCAKLVAEWPNLLG